MIPMSDNVYYVNLKIFREIIWVMGVMGTSSLFVFSWHINSESLRAIKHNN